MGKAAFRLCAALVLTGAGFAAANTAAAQEATVLYTAAPPEAVSLTAEGYLIFKGKQEGTMTATVFAVAGTVTGGEFTPRPVNATGYRLLTLRGLHSCSVSAGCDAFGLENARTPEDRLAAFLAMDLSTVTMFANSGARLNDHLAALLSSVRTTTKGLTRTKKTYLSGNLLYHLAAANKPRHISALVSAGADINLRDNDGNTPLHQAAQFNNAAALTILLSAGASINAKGASETAPLSRAAMDGNITLVSILADAGADLNTRSARLFTPLHHAALNGNAEIVRALLSAGAAVNLTIDDGRTPVHLAARNGHTAVITILAQTADMNIPDRHNKTPLDMALDFNHWSAAHYVALAGGICGAPANGRTVLSCQAADYNALTLALAEQDYPMLLRVAAVAVSLPVTLRDTVFRHAVTAGNLAVMNKLVEKYGAGLVNQLDAGGNTPMDMLQGTEGFAIVALTTWGAKCNNRCWKGFPRLSDGRACNASYEHANIRTAANTKILPGAVCTRDALAAAVSTRIAASVRYALAAGADTDIVLANGRTPLDLYNEFFSLSNDAAINNYFRARRAKCKKACKPSDYRISDGLRCYPEWGNPAVDDVNKRGWASSALSGREVLLPDFIPESLCRHENNYYLSTYPTIAVYHDEVLEKVTYDLRCGSNPPPADCTSQVRKRVTLFANHVIKHIAVGELSPNAAALIKEWADIRPGALNGNGGRDWQVRDRHSILGIAAVFGTDAAFNAVLNHPNLRINQPGRGSEYTPWDYIVYYLTRYPNQRKHSKWVARANAIKNKGGGCHKQCGLNRSARHNGWDGRLQTPAWLDWWQSGRCSIHKYNYPEDDPDPHFAAQIEEQNTEPGCALPESRWNAFAYATSPHHPPPQTQPQNQNQNQTKSQNPRPHPYNKPRI